MTPLLVVSLVLAWFVLSAGVCLAVCVMSSRFTAREERRTETGLWSGGARHMHALTRDSGRSPEHSKAA